MTKAISTAAMKLVLEKKGFLARRSGKESNFDRLVFDTFAWVDYLAGGNNAKRVDENDIETHNDEETSELEVPQPQGAHRNRYNFES
jgi:hypothetical protein